MDISAWIHNMGFWYYGFVFLWTFLEGETIVILSGIAARTGEVQLLLLFLSSWIGSATGDAAMFLTARYFGSSLFKRFPQINAPVSRAAKYLEQHALLFMLGYRFVYGIRNVSAIAISQSNISNRKFLLLNFLSAGVWALLFSMGGYLAGSALLAVAGGAAACGRIVFIGAMFCIGTAILVHTRKHWSRARVK